MRRPDLRRRARRAGFTLLEVMIAIGILAMMMTAIYGLQANAMRSVSYARDTQMASLLAREKMLELEWLLRKDNFALTEATLSGDFSDAEAPRFKWKAKILKVRPEAFEAGGEMTVSANPLAAQFAPAMQALTRQMAEQIREIRLGISWKDGRHEESFTVTTHVVMLKRTGGITPSPAPSGAGLTGSSAGAAATGSPTGSSGASK